MPNNATHTKPRQIRIPDEDWADFDVAAKAAGSERAAIIREFICWYLGRPGAKRPVRPKPDLAVDADPHEHQSTRGDEPSP
ncbi:CopG family transcriptional regulator [Streptomyces hoynatensis]|uniref:ribbon-helix-helix domain-containing protein n=1 Tax=Streptomyces hoynatensis TaxID=1141874 RepID=UPI0011C435E9|nr:CopG family transcriptional regulator [Streptomyces hoynatensis]